jgi:hypothetical protein
MREIIGNVILFPFFAVGWVARKLRSAFALMRDAIMAGFGE